jgi:tetratricopeptide (TPR) repeat protein/predicted Ser/Thr protein kinase
MNDPAASQPPTIPNPLLSSDQPPTPGTVNDPHRTADFPTPLATEAATPELPMVPGFLIEKELARGGMGIVYQARDMALNRTVAVKLLQDKYPADSSAAARFLEEAQITGQLQHPGIPPIYQVGTLANGRPFLAMKLIKGETLDAKIKRGDKINYLALIEAIAQAVGYAHAHGVIHRDLKPQNIMVGAFGEVQVMDWGLAKTLRQEDKERGRQGEDQASSGPSNDNASLSPPLLASPSPRHQTQAGSVLGTPAYMAPEQAAGAVDKIDQRSDVFGLGAVFCCMLTGLPPYTGTDHLTLMVNACMGETAEAFARLDACGAEPEVIALCKRCLAFVPAERPGDGNAVAAEVAALRAAADARAKQAEIDRAKAEVFAAAQQRHRRIWLALAASLLVGLLASSALAVWALHAEGLARAQEEQVRLEKDLKEEQRKKAVAQADLANGVKKFLQYDVLRLADPATQQQMPAGDKKYDADVKLRDVVLRASQAIEGKFSAHPLVEAELRLTLGFTLLGMGRADLAVTQLERSRALRAQHLGPDHPDTLDSMTNLANCYYGLGRRAEALKLHAETLARHQATVGPDHPNALWSMHNVATCYQALGRYAEALPLYEKILVRRKGTLGADHPDTLASMVNLASAYGEQGRHADALKLLDEALTRRQATRGPNHPDTLDSMDQLAHCYAALARPAEACKLCEDSLARKKVHLGLDHPSTLQSMVNLANYLEALNRHAEALKLREEAATRIKAVHGPDHPRTLGILSNLAGSYTALWRPQEAQATYADLIGRIESRLAQHPEESTLTLMLAGACCNMGLSLRYQGKPADALPWLAKAHPPLERFLAQQPNTFTAQLFLRNVHLNRAIVYEELGRFADADPAWAKALTLGPQQQKAALLAMQAEWKAKRKSPPSSKP